MHSQSWERAKARRIAAMTEALMALVIGAAAAVLARVLAGVLP